MDSIQQILEWKRDYGDVFQLVIGEREFVYRPIGREEYKQIILMDLDLGEFQEMICSLGVIYPEVYDYTKGVAGIAAVLSDAILDASGLLDGQAGELLQEFQEEMLNFDYQADCVIHEAFPEYTLEEISTWPVRKTMYYLSRAEWVLQTLKGVPVQMLKPGQAEEEGQQQAPPPTPPPMPIENQHEMPTPQTAPKDTQPEGVAQTEEEVLAMLASTGQKVTNPTTGMDEVYPELNWFKHMDELKGEFD